MTRRVLIFANPTSGRGRGVALAASLPTALTAAGFSSELCQQNPAEFANACDLAAAHALIVVGGDGTLRAVVDRAITLVGDAELPPILFVGLGTANLMQRHLGLVYPRRNPATAVVGCLTAGRTRAIDLGTVGGRVFLLMTGVGYDAGVVHNLARVRRGPIRKWSYVVPALKYLRTQAYPPVTVTVDGLCVNDAAPAQVFVGNVAEYGTGLSVLIDADSSDGLLDVCVLPCGNHVEFVKMMWHLARGGHKDAPGVLYLRGREVTIDAAAPLPVQIDGDPAGTTPVRLGLLARRAHFIVP